MSDRRTIHRAARVHANTFNPDDNTIDVVWSTGATVRRFDWDGEFDEVLSMEPDAVRLDRLNAGAPLLDTHDSSEVGRVIGNVVRGSARIEGAKGLATVRLTTAKGAADIVTKIREGVIANISVGYWIHGSSESEVDGLRTVTATDWEPLEISAVPVPADPGAQFRSAAPPRRTRAASTGRVAEIRRMARKAGRPKFGEQHVRAGTSAERFFDLLAQRLARGSAIRTMKEPTVTRTVDKPSTFARELDKGAAEMRRSTGTVLGAGLDTYAGIGRAASEGKSTPLDDDNEGDDDVADDDEEDGADAKAEKDDEDRKRGADTVRNVMGRGVRSSATTSLAKVRDHRRESVRADRRRVDDGLGAEAGKREAESLLGRRK